MLCLGCEGQVAGGFESFPIAESCSDVKPGAEQAGSLAGDLSACGYRVEASAQSQGPKRASSDLGRSPSLERTEKPAVEAWLCKCTKGQLKKAVGTLPTEITC